MGGTWTLKLTYGNLSQEEPEKGYHFYPRNESESENVNKSLMNDKWDKMDIIINVLCKIVNIQWSPFTSSEYTCTYSEMIVLYMSKNKTGFCT